MKVNKNPLNFKDISNLRLISQQVINSQFTNAKDVVSWMGAIQAQDINMSKWAIGIRLPNSTNGLIEDALNSGEILRTHILRPTWHFISSDDIIWMLQLTAPKIKSSMKSRDKDLGLDEVVFKKCNAIIEKVLNGGNHLTREELLSEVVKAGIAVDNNRASHLLMRAELDGIICSGKIKSNKYTYALLQERVVQAKTFNPEGALVELARRYFTSHCPATLQDFIWWSGLTTGEAKQALEMIKSQFVTETIGNQTYWLTNSFSIPKIDDELVYLLPAFDEFIISYKDRTPSLPFENHIKAVSTNGIFRPTIVLNGQVVGIWKRTIKKDEMILETEFFESVSEHIKDLVRYASVNYGKFLDKEIEIILLNNLCEIKDL